MSMFFSIRPVVAVLFVSLVATVAAAQPVITNQPVSIDRSTGGTATFTVGANGALGYQWRLNGSNLDNATNATLTIPNLIAANAGTYQVAVFNAVGAVNSALVSLRLTNFVVLPFSNNFPGGTNFQDSLVGRGANFNANKQSGEPAHARKPGGSSVWLTWVAGNNGIVTFKTAGSGFDTLLAAYTGNSVANLTEVEYDDDSAGFLTDQISFNVHDGDVYRIAVDGLGGAQGDILLKWNLEVTNDVLPPITTHPQSQTVALNSPVTLSVSTRLPGLSYQWFFNGNPIAGATDFSFSIQNVTNSDAGTYFVRAGNAVRFRDSHPARLQINIPASGTPLQDVRSTEKLGDSFFAGQGGGFPFNGVNAVAHGYSGTQLFSTTTSTKDIGEPNHAGVVGGASEWFAFQADTNGTLYLDTEGSSFDTVLAVYVGPGDSYVTLTNVASDNNSGSNGITSKLNLPATVNTIYWIAVDGANSNTPAYGPYRGSVTLHYRLVQPLTITNVVETTNNNGRIIFKVNSTPNLLTKVQANTNVNTTNWVALLTNTPVSGSFSFTNTNIFALPKRFYRAINQF